MSFYQITLIARQLHHGHTQTFYRQADSGRAASDFGGVDGLAPWLDLWPLATTLQAVRAQEVDQLKRLFLRLAWIGGKQQDYRPETPGVSAKIKIHFRGGGHRMLELRGIADELIEHDARGDSQPTALFLRAFDRLANRMKALDLRGRRLIDHPKHIVTSYGLHPDSDQLTLIKVRDTGFVPAPGTYVDFGGGRDLKFLQRSRGYLVLDSEPGWVSIYHEWGSIKDFRGGSKVWIRQLEYEYPTFDRIEFTGWGTRDTGPAYHPVTWLAREPWRCPVSPCGRIVDFQRITHDGDLAPFRYDTSLTVRVRWYFPEIIPGAAHGEPQRIEEIPAVPYEHPFGSRLWEQAGDFLPALGMRRVFGKNSGRPPALLRGIGLCGSRDAWENGAGATEKVKPINVTTGQPCCCGPGSLMLTGGAAGDGPAPALVVQGGAAVGPPTWEEIEGGGAGGGRVELLHEVRGGAAAGRWVPTIPKIYTCLECPDGAALQWGLIVPAVGTGSVVSHWGTHILNPAIWGACFWENFLPSARGQVLFLGSEFSQLEFIWFDVQARYQGLPVCKDPVTLTKVWQEGGTFNTWPDTFTIYPIGPILDKTVRGGAASGGRVELDTTIEVRGGAAAGGRLELVQEVRGGAASGGRVNIEEASSAQAGPNSPTAAASVAFSGTERPWQDLGNPFTSNDAWANTNGNLNATAPNSQILRLTGFGFAVPAGATIVGVQVAVERHAINGGDCRDDVIQLCHAGGQIGTNQADTGTPWPADTDATASYGGSGDNWSASLTPAIVNAATFGLSIRCARGPGLGISRPHVDHVTLTVWYTP